MTVKMVRLFVALAIIISLLAVSGCLSFLGGQEATPTPAAPAPGTAYPTSNPAPNPSIDIPVPSPGTTIIWTPGSGETTVGNSTLPSPSPVANGTNPTVTPTPVISGTASGWGTSKTTYNRGDTATGWVNVTNTGNVPITAVDFTIVIKRTVLFVPIEKSYSYSKTGLNILPGETQRVEFSQAIPAEYSGMSTAGDYQLKVTAKLANKEIGSYTTALKIV